MDQGETVTVQRGWTADRRSAQGAEVAPGDLAAHLLAEAAAKGQRLYALLDLAQGDLALEQLALYDGDSPFEVLEPGRSEPDLQEVSPVLVPCGEVSGLLTWLLTEARGQSFGVLLASEYGPAELAAHLNPLTEVLRQEDDEPLIFRFQDPRVLSVYLPTCTAEELDRVFGPVRRFWVEADDGARLLDFEHQAPYAPPKNEPEQQPENEQDGDPDEQPDARPAPLVIRKEQMEVFRQAVTIGFVKRATKLLGRHLPQQCQQLGPGELKQTIEHGIQRAAAHGIQAEQDVCLYLGLMLIFGKDFDTDPAQPWAARVLANPRYDGSEERMEALSQAAEAHMGQPETGSGD